MILALDCATSTGWCAGDGSAVPILGSVQMPSGVEPGPFCDFWRRWIEHHLADIKPSIVIFEAPFIHSNMNGTTMRKLIGLANETEVACLRARIPCEETTPSHVKKVLTGDGRAEKPDMMRMAQKCGLKPKTHDEADAFGVWIAALHHHARQYQQHWDTLRFKGGSLL